MTPSRTEALRREWHERLNRLLDGLVEPEAYHAEEHQEQLREQGYSDPPESPPSTLSGVKRHILSRRLRG